MSSPRAPVNDRGGRLALDGDFVCWTDYDYPDGRIMRIAKSGGVPEPLAENQEAPLSELAAVVTHPGGPG